MNTKILVSFVIPVFNTKEYLENCIQPISEMNGHQIEIIAVDDKSTDGSFKELLRLQTIYPMLMVLQNKSNRGVSYTRNIGMSVASGKYIAFVDSDDCISHSAYENMLRIIQKENAMAIIGNISKEATLGKEVCNYKVFSSKTVFTPNHVAGGIYLSEYLKKYGIVFHENMIVGEDQMFNYEVATQTESNMISYEGNCYTFTERPVSLMHGKRSESKKKAIFESHFEMLKTFVAYKQKGMPDQEAIEIKVLQQTQTTIYTLMQVGDSQFVREKMKELKEKGYYPYKQPSWLLPQNEPRVKRIMLSLLPNPTGAYLFHIAWKMLKS